MYCFSCLFGQNVLQGLIRTGDIATQYWLPPNDKCFFPLDQFSQAVYALLAVIIVMLAIIIALLLRG